MGVCCVEGCTSSGKDEEISYFEFPIRRPLRRKWLDVIKIGNKIPVGTVVCSRHFLPEEYDTVRGRVRLKGKVVPSLLLDNQKLEAPPSKFPPNASVLESSRLTSELDDKKSLILESSQRKSRRKSEKTVETPRIKKSDKAQVLESPRIVNRRQHATTPVNEPLRIKIRREPDKNPVVEPLQTNQPQLQETPILESPKIIIRRERKKSYSIYYPTKTVESSNPKVDNVEKETIGDEESTDLSQICKVVSKDTVNTLASSPQNTIDSTVPDPKQPPDFEDMITNYQIKNKPNALRPDEMDIGIDKECERNDTILVDDKGDTPPVFIEISADKDTNPSNGNGQDCLMVLESVQVDVDPSTLMLPEREPEVPENDSDVEIVIPERKQDPISLLTSSDEDEVILQEPKIDTVEVSDDTDEDNIPLLQLVKTKPAKKKRKKKSKQGPKNAEDLRNIVWGCGYEFYCVKCPFVTSDSVAYDNHMQDHERALNVCPVCSYATASKSQYSRHLRKHKDEKNYQCHLCDYRAKHNMSLMYHLQNHRKDRGKVAKKGFKCVKCGFRSDYKGDVVKHLKVCSSEKNCYPCDSCRYVTKWKSDLKRHWSLRHGDRVEVDSDESYQPGWD